MTYLTSLSRLLACAGSLAALSIVSVACSSVDTPATVKGADSPSGKERDTKIVHEPCDGGLHGIGVRDVKVKLHYGARRRIGGCRMRKVE